jgi:SAM-dependent methyltransferase
MTALRRVKSSWFATNSFDGVGSREPRRRGAVEILDGVPVSSWRTTSSLIPDALLGAWLAAEWPESTGRLLDAGCGNAPYHPWYRDLVGLSVAIDVVGSAANVRGGLDRLPFPEHTFDIVLCTEVLEHIEDSERTTAELFRVLVPGGVLLVSTPFLYPVHEAPWDFRRLTHFGLRNLLSRHGFEVRSIAAKGGIGSLLGHAAVAAAAQLLDGLGRAAGLRDSLSARRPLAAFLGAVQEPFVRSIVRRPPERVSGLAARASLGYMAVAERPS